MAIKCTCKDTNTPADPSMECYIDSIEHYNCFEVYKYYLHSKEHTLHECAKLLNISHTTVKQCEISALRKLKDLVESGQISELAIESLLKTSKN